MIHSCPDHSPVSVLGVANVTSSLQISQQTSSSALPPLPNHCCIPPAFRLRFSKNCTPICPLGLEFGEVVEESCRVSW